MSWHKRYPYGDGGRAVLRHIATHAVDDRTLISLCGRNAADWFAMNADEGEVDCARCLSRIAKMEGRS